MAPITLERRVAFNSKEAARILGLSHNVLLRLIREGQLRSVRAGRRHLISEAAISRFLAGEGAPDGR